MADVIFVGGRTFIETRSEDSQSTPGNYGTYATGGATDKMLLVTNFNPSLKNNMIKIFTLGGGRSYKHVVPGKFEASGSFEYDVQNGNFLNYAYGSVSAGSTATKSYDGASITGTPTTALKTYMVSEANVLDSFSMTVSQISDQSTDDVVHLYLGGKVNQLALKADTDNPLKATVDWVAQMISSTTTGTATAPTTSCYADVPKMFYNGILSIGSGDYGAAGTGTSDTMTDATKSWTADEWNTNYILIDSTGQPFIITDNNTTTLTVDGTPATGAYWITPKSTLATALVIQCNSIDTTLTNNLESYWSISNDTGRGVKFLLEKQREYSLTLDLNFSNSEQLGRFYTGASGGGSAGAITPATTSAYTPFMVMIDYKTAIGDGDDYRAMRIIYDDVVFDEVSLPVNPQDILKQTVTASANRSVAFYITDETQ